MNAKQKMKPAMRRRCVFIILLLFIGINLYAGDEIFNSGYGGGNAMPFSGTTTNSDINGYSDNTGILAYKPFESVSNASYYNTLLKAGPGDRPDLGGGIGVVSIKDGLLFFSLFIIVYACLTRRYYASNKLQR